MKDDSLLQLKYRLARICLEHTELSKISRMKVEKLFTEIMSTDIEKIDKINRLEYKIESIIAKKEKSSTSKIIKLKVAMDIIKKDRAIKFNDEEKERKVRTTLGNGSWGDDFIRALSDYNKERSLKRFRENEAKRKQNLPDNNTVQKGGSNLNNQSNKNSIYTDASTQTRTTQQKIDKSEIKGIIAEKIDKELAKGLYGTLHLENEEKKAIRDAVGIYDKRVIEALEKGTKLLILKQKFEHYEKMLKNPFKKPEYIPDIKDVLVAADEIVQFLPAELLAPSGTEQSNLANKIVAKVNPDKCIENYETIYKVFIDYYEKLPLEEQEKIKKETEKDLKKLYPHLNMEEFEIPSPDKVVSKVNTIVSRKMIENNSSYGAKKKPKNNYRYTKSC